MLRKIFHKRQKKGGREKSETERHTASDSARPNATRYTLPTPALPGPNLDSLDAVSVHSPSHASSPRQLALPGTQSQPTTNLDHYLLSAQVPVADEVSKWTAGISSAAVEPSASRETSASSSRIKLAFAHSSAKAGRDLGSGNVSQQGDNNIAFGNANQIHIHHASHDHDHEVLLRQISEMLRPYIVSDATLSKDIHGEPSVCYKGTREELLERVLSWVGARANPAIVDEEVTNLENDSIDARPGMNQQEIDIKTRALCIVGAPGSGKSTILNTLIINLLREAARRSPGLVSAHYCIRRNLQSTTDSSKVLPTLILQLAQRDLAVAKHVCLQLHSALQTGIFAPEYQEELFLEAITAYQQTVFIIIDALDEASTPASLAASLSRVIPLSPPNLRLLLATRNEHGVLQGLGESLIPKIVLEIPTDESVAEVRDYINHRLRNGLTNIFGSKPDWHDWPNDSQLQSLSDRAGGLFIWARTAVDYILSRVQRRGLTNRDRWIKDVEKFGMADVNALYMFILEKQLEDEEEADEDDNEGVIRNGMQMVLGFIIVAEHSLPLDDIIGFLDFENFDVGHFVGLARSILVPGTEAIIGSTIPWMHKTFVDFITSERASTFRIHVQGQHLLATDRCFSSMEKHLCFNIYGLRSSFVENSKPEELVERVPKGLLYASSSWLYHLQLESSEPILLPSRLRSIETLFYNNFLFWLEIVGLAKEALEAARSTISALVYTLRPSSSTQPTWQSGIGWEIRWWGSTNTQSPEAARLADFAEDAAILMEGFGDCIGMSTPHIYISLPAFSPTDSIVAHHYRSKLAAAVIPRLSTLPSSWDAGMNEIETRGGKVWSISFSPCGRQLVAGYQAGLIRVWNVETDQSVFAEGALQGQSGDNVVACFAPNGLLFASCSADRTVRIWASKTGQCIVSPLTGHKGSVNSVSFSSDSTRIVSCSVDRTIRVWDARTGDCLLGPLMGHSDSIGSVSYAPDSSVIASGSADKTIRIWDPQSGKCILGPLTGHEGAVSAISFFPNSQRLVSCSADKTLRIWDTRTGNCVHGPLMGHTGVVSSVCFFYDSRYIASGSYDRTVRIWDVETGTCVVGPIGGAAFPINTVAVSPNGKFLAVGCDDGTIRLWDAQALLSTARCKPVDGTSKDHVAGQLTDQTVMDGDGWTLGPNGERLFCTPFAYRGRFWRPSTVRILGGPAMIKPDLSNLITGEEWLDSFTVQSSR